MNNSKLWIVLVVTAAGVMAGAQGAQFEVASVKLHTSDDPRVYMVAQPGGRFVRREHSAPAPHSLGVSAAGRSDCRWSGRARFDAGHSGSWSSTPCSARHRIERVVTSTNGPCATYGRSSEASGSGTAPTLKRSPTRRIDVGSTMFGLTSLVKSGKCSRIWAALLLDCP
jgi:hypothetical protein